MKHGPHQLPTAPARVRQRRNLRVTGLLAAPLVGLVVILAACGSGSGSDPGGSKSAPTSSPTGAAGSSSSSQSGAVAFAQCVRSHGVPDFPTPRTGTSLSAGATRTTRTSSLRSRPARTCCLAGQPPTAAVDRTARPSSRSPTACRRTASRISPTRPATAPCRFPRESTRTHHSSNRRSRRAVRCCQITAPGLAAEP